jgi:calcineurin-like phosphoesterase family protein
MKIFFTSNLLLSKESMLESRGFDTVEEMNEAIITNWNTKVSSDDIVYHLGNFAWDPLVAETALSRLNGTINFLVGEWDAALFEIIDRYPQHIILKDQIFYIDSFDLALSYWPMLDWPGKRDGVIHLFGGHKYKTIVNKKEIKVNVNCDNWDLTPVELESIKGMVELFTKK